MKRLFGTAKPKAPAATLDDISSSIDSRGGQVDEKVTKLEEELKKYKTQMSKLKKGSPAYKQAQQRALRVLKQKKMYDKQRDHLYNQQFNIDQTKFAQDNVKDTAGMVEAMQVASKALQQSYQDIDIDQVEDLHDDMTEMLEMAEEVNETMGRAYGVPDELDENDLMEELEGLEEELEMEDDTEVPSYLVSAATAAKTDHAQAPSQEASLQLDEFGLPKVPARKLAI